LAAVGLVLVAAGVAGSAVGIATVAHHRARNAADLGALAGAARVVEGRDAACQSAADIASANRARLVSCAVDGWEIVVTVEVAAHPLPGMTRTVAASARAGPVGVAAQPWMGFSADAGLPPPAASVARGDSGARSPPRPRGA
jgi:secretion/DNA translocation related TadE-like protein